MKNLVAICLMMLLAGRGRSQESCAMHFFPANDPHIQFTGRIDFSNAALPRFWQPGVYFEFNFSGSCCDVILNDEVLWGSSHNYLEIVVDGMPKRIRMQSRTDTIRVALGLPNTLHHVIISKNTEANIGYLELVGVRCPRLMQPAPRPKHKIEFIGNSITCGASSDPSAIPCGKGVWQDQHNAYLSYGAIAARNLQAQYHLSSVSGIGLMHSCCNMDIVMPQVFDKVSMRNNELPWDFSRYQPDLVTVCLGQNDGIQDSTEFSNNYIAFIERLQAYYPKAVILCLGSPMADASLAAFLKNNIAGIIQKMKSRNNRKIASFFFSRQFNHGCDFHPDLAEHAEMAKELTGYVRALMKWK